MFDLHCHLLPGIDDGPRDLNEALGLARMVRDQGITHAVVTPHIHLGRYDNERVTIAQAIESFADELKQAGIDLEIAAGAEVRIDPRIPSMIRANAIPFIGKIDGEDLLLLEFPHSHIPPGSEKLVQWLRAHRVLPLIAHPERNKAVIARPDKMRPLVEMGCLLQLTAGAVAGLFGAPPQRCAVELLERGWVSILATDCHDTKFRIPALSAGREAAAVVVGEQEADRMVAGRPRDWVGSRFGLERAA